MQDSNMFISLHSVPFSRRGSFFTFSLDPLSEEQFAMADLYLGSCRVGARIRNNRLIKLSVIHNGIEVPYALSSTKSELIMNTDYGNIRFCIAEKGLVLGKADGSVGLRCTCAFTPVFHEMAKSIKGGNGVQIEFADMPILVMVPINGKLSCHAPWNWRRTCSEYAVIDLIPEGNEDLYFAIEEFVNRDGEIRCQYPRYEEKVEEVEEDFAEFLKIAPVIDDPVCGEMYERAVWTSWAHLVGPDGYMKREMMSMMLYYISMCASWQQSYQAIVFSQDIQRSFEFLLSMFDVQQSDGHVPAFVMDTSGRFSTQQSPFQGFATCWLLDHRDCSVIDKEKLKTLYNGLCRLTDWWLSHRIDSDGLLMYLGPDESGWDDSTVYIDSCMVKTPDLYTYLVFQFEAQSKLARMLDMSEESEMWAEKSKEFLNIMLENFWDGEHFVAINTAGEKFYTENICLYQPIMLGKRLPQEIIEKITDDLMTEGKFLTPFGFASESVTSPYNDPFRGWMCGPVIAPVQFMINIGLEECGKIECAREAAKRYCSNLVKQNTLLHIINPFNGEPQLKGRDEQLRQPWTSWCSGVFLFLASRYC